MSTVRARERNYSKKQAIYTLNRLRQNMNYNFYPRIESYIVNLHRKYCRDPNNNGQMFIYSNKADLSTVKAVARRAIGKVSMLMDYSLSSVNEYENLIKTDTTPYEQRYYWLYTTISYLQNLQYAINDVANLTIGVSAGLCGDYARQVQTCIDAYNSELNSLESKIMENHELEFLHEVKREAEILRLKAYSGMFGNFSI